MPVCTFFNTFGNVLKTFNTDDYGRTIRIGRASDCDVSLMGAADNTVSREQLLLKKNGGDWILENVGHAVLYKDGVEAPSTTIKDGDVFRFSAYFLCIGHKTGPSKYELTWAFETDNNQRSGVLWPGVNIIGSSKDNEVTIRNGELSRHHGKVTVKDDRVFFEKFHSSCRVSINGHSIGDKQVEISTDDEIMLSSDLQISLIKNTRKSMQKIQGSGNAVESKARNNKIASFIIGLLAVLIFLFLIIVIYSMLL